MAMIEFQEGGIEVDAELVAEGFGIDQATLRARMREGKITSRCEQGVDEDEGRYRLTFFSGDRRLRVIVDAAGHVVRRSVIDFAGQKLPPATHKPG